MSAWTPLWFPTKLIRCGTSFNMNGRWEIEQLLPIQQDFNGVVEQSTSVEILAIQSCTNSWYIM